MTGELFEINDNTLKVVALDGHESPSEGVLKNSYDYKESSRSG